MRKGINIGQVEDVGESTGYSLGYVIFGESRTNLRRLVVRLWRVLNVSALLDKLVLGVVQERRYYNSDLQCSRHASAVIEGIDRT